MELKYCPRCKIEKSLSQFSKNKNRKDGHAGHCKDCNKKYYIENKKTISQYKKDYYINHIEHEKQKTKQYRDKNREKYILYSREYYKNNKEELLEKQKIYQSHNIEKIKKRLKNRYDNDIQYKLKHLLRTRISHLIKNQFKIKTTIELLGCSIEFLKKHLESQFKEGMSWENYGTGWHGKGMKEWHIDHKKPCYKFDFTDLEQQKECFHYSNLRPLWAAENCSKKYN